MIRREVDSALVNRIANDPSVAPTFGMPDCGPMDFREVIERRDDHVVLSDGAAVVAICEWSAPRVWQVHAMALPEARGRHAVQAFREAADWMFEREGARLLWAQVAQRHVAQCARMVGFRRTGGGFHHVLGAVDYYEAERW